MARAAAPRTDQPGRDQALGGQPGQPGPVEPAEPAEPTEPTEPTPIGTEYTIPIERIELRVWGMQGRLRVWGMQGRLRVWGMQGRLRAWAGMNGWRGRSGAGQAGRMIAGPGLRRATGTR
jgi:hypothetical protein